MSQNPQVIYANLSAEQEPIQIESFCPNCEQNGKTTIMLTKIPFFKDVVIMAFYCENCGERNSEVQFGGELAELGANYTFNVEKTDDLNRECIKSEYAVIRIPSLSFEIPANKKGSINTIEGFISNTVKDLEHYQPVRRVAEPEIAQKIDEFIEKLKKILNGESFPFQFEVLDPSGNSFIQNPLAPKEDPQLKIKKYRRTLEELVEMGFSLENAQEELKGQVQEPETIIKQKQEEKVQPLKEEVKQQEEVHLTAHKHDFSNPIISDKELREEAMVFSGPCHVCLNEGSHKMCTISVPYFKDILIMGFECPHCGIKTTEVKTGGEVTPQGKIMTLKAKSEQDLKRDVFKSDTASLEIPEIELQMGYGTLGGLYTTVEGILAKMLSHLEENNPFAESDSNSNFSIRMKALFAQLRKLKDGGTPFTLIIKDLMDNSFIQNPNYPADDPNVEVHLFDRTPEDNDFLGIDMMKTENYQE